MDYLSDDLPMHDKAMHAIVGEAFGATARADGMTRAHAYVLFVTLAVGKELADKGDARHASDPFDAAATASAAIAAYEGWRWVPIIQRDAVAVLVRCVW